MAGVTLVLKKTFKALMFLTLMRPSLVLFLVLWLKLVKDFLKVRCRLALLPFLISCLIWLDLVASLPLIKERILVIILLLHFLSLMLGSVLVLMLPLLVWLTPFFFSSRRRHTSSLCDWSSDVCSSDLVAGDVLSVHVQHHDVARGDADDGIPSAAPQRVGAGGPDAGPALRLQARRRDGTGRIDRKSVV